MSLLPDSLLGATALFAFFSTSWVGVGGTFFLPLPQGLCCSFFFIIVDGGDAVTPAGTEQVFRVLAGCSKAGIAIIQQACVASLSTQPSIQAQSLQANGRRVVG